MSRLGKRVNLWDGPKDLCRGVHDPGRTCLAETGGDHPGDPQRLQVHAALRAHEPARAIPT